MSTLSKEYIKGIVKVIVKAILKPSLKINDKYNNGMSFQIPCMRAELDKTLDQLLSHYFTKRFTYQEEIPKLLRVYHQ